MMRAGPGALGMQMRKDGGSADYPSTCGEWQSVFTGVASLLHLVTALVLLCFLRCDRV